MRGRKPIPTHLKLIRGNPGKRAIRGEPQPQQPSKVPEPPGFLLPAAKAEWHRLAGELIRLGLLTPLDLRPFAALCQAVGRWEEAERLLAESGTLTVTSSRGTEMPSPLLRIARDAAATVVRISAEFGLSPSARTRLRAGPPSGGRKFGDLLA
jgi:P27 family predicted phage terminase small subunit